MMAAARDADGVRSGTSSARRPHGLRLTALTELLAQRLHGLQQGLVHVLSHHRVIHLHPELSGPSDRRTAHLDEEEILRMTAPANIHQLQHHRRHVRVEFDKVDRLVR